MKRLLMWGVIGTVMFAGSGVFAEITATPAKAAPPPKMLKKQKITVVITPPTGAKFVSASWQGPHGLKGKLNNGTTIIAATQYSVTKDDYVFTVTWSKPGEKPWDETAKSTLYRHAVSQVYGKAKKDKLMTEWQMGIKGNASPIGATIHGRIKFAKKIGKDSKVLGKNDYNLQKLLTIRIPHAVQFDISALSEVDGLLRKKVINAIIKKNQKAFLKPMW